jgi:CBS-domain-containing membrane protein
MYNPHGVFIALEGVGYLLLGATIFFTALAVATGERLQRAVRILCLVSSALAIGSLVVLAALYRTDLGYRYEVTAIAIDWITLILVAGLLGLLFRREARER